MVGLYVDKFHKNKDGQYEPKFKTLFAIEIPRSEFTYVNAVNKIIELNELFDFDWIALDRGYGEVQVELLKQYGIANPQSGLADKVIGYQFGQKIDVRDPYTHQVDKKHMKPFMVNNSVITFEKEKIVLDPKDKNLIEQLEGYTIKSISTTGLPVYSSENEHSLDALNLCLLLMEQKYGSLFRSIMSSKILSIKPMVRKDGVLSRDVGPNTQVERPDSSKVAVGIRSKHQQPSRSQIATTSRSTFSTSSAKLYKRSSF